MLIGLVRGGESGSICRFVFNVHKSGSALILNYVNTVKWNDKKACVISDDPHARSARYSSTTCCCHWLWMKLLTPVNKLGFIQANAALCARHCERTFAVPCWVPVRISKPSTCCQWWQPQTHFGALCYSYGHFRKWVKITERDGGGGDNKSRVSCQRCSSAGSLQSIFWIVRVFWKWLNVVLLPLLLLRSEASMCCCEYIRFVLCSLEIREGTRLVVVTASYR